MKKREIDECCAMLTACIVRQLKALSLEELREAYTAVCKITDKKKPDSQ